jgi:hypothetical protein
MRRTQGSGPQPSHYSGHWHLILAPVVLMCVGCSDGTGGPPRTELPGAVVISVMVPPLDSIRASAWSSRIVYSTLGLDTLQIGGGESLFARFLSDGSLAIANGPQIVILMPDGSFGRTLARGGDGPGEFRMISSLGLGSDGSIFASDHLAARFTELTSSGELRRVIPRMRPISGEMDDFPFAVLTDGQIVAAPWQARPARKLAKNEKAGSIVRDDIPIVTIDSTGQITDTLLLLPGLERSNGFVAPFARSALYAGRGRKWVAGVSDSLDLNVFDESHPTMHLLARRTVVSASSQARQTRDSLIKEQFGAEIGFAIVKTQAEMPVAGPLPNVGGVVVDDSGAIWIGDYATPGSTERQWYVFGADGRCLGQLPLPAFGDPLLPTRTELLDAAGGRVALIRESSDGGVYIEVRAVSRDQSSSPLSGNGCAQASFN